jgi:hypothetical protein
MRLKLRVALSLTGPQHLFSLLPKIIFGLIARI